MSKAVYEEIKDLPNHPEKVLIDVREPAQLKQTGAIPTSINIPFGGVVAALSLSDEEFKAKYNRMKPSKKSVIIFTSKTGDRARRTVAALEGLGYENVKYYEGSWIEWAELEGLSAQSSWSLLCCGMCGGILFCV